jgi:hypothetical protein
MGLCRSACNPCARHEPYRELPIGGFPHARKSQSTVWERRGERSGEPKARDEGEAEDLPCAWWRPRSGTTLTRAKIRKPAAGSSWKKTERSEYPG